MSNLRRMKSSRKLAVARSTMNVCNPAHYRSSINSRSAVFKQNLDLCTPNARYPPCFWRAEIKVLFEKTALLS
jgi:hypothetical protein